MPNVTLRTDVTLTLTMDLSARVEFGDPGGSFAVEDFRIEGIEGIGGKTEMKTDPATGQRLPVVVLEFDDAFLSEVLSLVDYQLAAEAR